MTVPLTRNCVFKALTTNRVNRAHHRIIRHHGVVVCERYKS